MDSFWSTGVKSSNVFWNSNLGKSRAILIGCLGQMKNFDRKAEEIDVFKWRKEVLGNRTEHRLGPRSPDATWDCQNTYVFGFVWWFLQHNRRSVLAGKTWRACGEESQQRTQLDACRGKVRYPQGNSGITPWKTNEVRHEEICNGLWTKGARMFYVLQSSLPMYAQDTVQQLERGESSKTCNELTILRPHVGQLSLIYGLIMTSSSLRTALFLESSTLEWFVVVSCRISADVSCGNTECLLRDCHRRWN